MYSVPWPNSFWHLDGYSRRIQIFFHCSTNNLSSTVLGLFECAIEQDSGLWPSHSRVENTSAVCDAVVAVRGESRGSFIAGPSTRSKRIEGLWRDAFRYIRHVFYYTFHVIEQTGLLDVENPIHMFTLQYVYIRRINCALSEWMVSFHDHPFQTELNWSPNQL